MRRYEDLEVWQRGHALVPETYRVTGRFPRDERFGLVSQMRRSAVSIPSNVAEGCDRGTDPWLARSYAIASGSAAGLDYYWLLCHDLTYLDTDRFRELRRDTRLLRVKLHRLAAHLRSG